MATKKKYESMRIMSLEGSVLYKNEGFTALKNGKPDPDAFRGMLDESLDTLKLKEVYKKHEDEIGYPYLDGKKLFCRAVVNLSFNRAVKLLCGLVREFARVHDGIFALVLRKTEVHERADTADGKQNIRGDLTHFSLSLFDQFKAAIADLRQSPIIVGSDPRPYLIIYSLVHFITQ